MLREAWSEHGSGVFVPRALDFREGGRGEFVRHQFVARKGVAANEARMRGGSCSSPRVPLRPQWPIASAELPARKARAVRASGGRAPVGEMTEFARAGDACSPLG